MEDFAKKFEEAIAKMSPEEQEQGKALFQAASNTMKALHRARKDLKERAPREVYDLFRSLVELGILRGVAFDEDAEVNPRREANAWIASSVRNSILEDFHAQSTVIGQAEMKRLMQEATAKLSIWLLMKELLLEDGHDEAYEFAVRAQLRLSGGDWDTDFPPNPDLIE